MRGENMTALEYVRLIGVISNERQASLLRDVIRDDDDLFEFERVQLIQMCETVYEEVGMNNIVDEKIESAYHEGYKKGYIQASDSYRKLEKKVPDWGNWAYHNGRWIYQFSTALAEVCTECGNGVSGIMNFCPYCGVMLRDDVLRKEIKNESTNNKPKD